MTIWHIGTVGFGYKEWQGSFYPAGLKSQDRLTHYAQFFDSVEIDTTFYGTPRLSTLRGWVKRTPDDFLFCPKTPRDISHSNYLPNESAAMAQFVEAMQEMGGKLGPILIQFPPYFTLDAFEKLQAFLAALPPTARYAVEFRDDSWRDQAAYDLLRHHNIAWVSADYIHLPPEIHATADFLYLRFIGEHGAFPLKGDEQLDRTERLKMWLAQIDAAPAVPEAFGFFNNDFSGHSPATANRFRTLLGLATDYPQISTQPRLL